MSPYIWLAVAAYLVIISVVAVAITIYDKKIAIKNGRIEEAAAKKASGKKAASKASSGKGTAKSKAQKTTSGKKAAGKNAKAPTAIRRVPEKTLLIISALGGSIAMLITMRAIRHKTQHAKFMVGIPVIILLQCAAAVALVILL